MSFMAEENETTIRPRFWEQWSLSEMNQAEWEALCDGCAQCCLVRLQDADTGEIYLTHVACALLDLSSCRCTDYANRTTRATMCMALTPENLPQATCLPDTCAYRCLAENRPLPEWHPLLDSSQTGLPPVHIGQYAITEEAIHPEQLEEHITGHCEARDPGNEPRSR